MTVSTDSEGKPQIRPRVGDDGFRAMCLKHIARYFGIRHLCGVAMRLHGGIFIPAPSSLFAAAGSVKVAQNGGWSLGFGNAKCFEGVLHGCPAIALAQASAINGVGVAISLGDCALLSKTIENKSRCETPTLDGVSVIAHFGSTPF